ncbi:WD repeat-containing protein 82-like [Bradysia coprophila]|uniref:WD repeat-containing protein 82-like n=1 Tax=Bradysia coprophila TaxID=38358 RepID=UPI00187DBB2C|nr:WD repeat-containing protein 82-like [Bradysia coprophila]
MQSETVKIKLFDELTRSFKVVKAFENGDRITAIDFSPDGEQLMSCSADDTISIYNCELGIQTALLNSKKYGVDLIRFTDEGGTAIHSSTKIDDNIRYLNVNNNKYFHYFTGHAKKVVSLSVSPSNNTFLSTSLDKTLRMWDLRLKDYQKMLHITGRPIAAYDPDGIVFAVGVNSGSGSIKLYDTRVFDKGPFSTFKMSGEKECDWISLKFSNDGKTILISTDGSSSLLIDAFFGTHLQTLTGYANNDGIPIESSFSPDSQYVFAGSSDGRVHVWNAASGYKVCVLNSGHPSPVQCVQFNPKYVMFSSACSDVAFWLPTVVNIDEI